MPPLVAGKPFQPLNGFVTLRMVKDPAIMERHGLTLANLGLKGVFIGEVTAIDTAAPSHCVAAGDVIYMRDPDLTLAFKTDGGDTQYQIRECLIAGKVSGITADVVTEADAKAIQQDALAKSEAINTARRIARPQLVSP